MSYVARSDTELLAFAREGVASAFAVLLYRHGPEILELAQQDPDPVGAVVATYIRAMRDLPNADPDDVRLWLLGFATEEIEGEVELPAAASVSSTATSASAAPTTVATGGVASQAANGTGRAVPPGRGPVDAPPLETDDDLDEVWAELALRWPTGRVPRHLPSWAIWVVTTVVLVALAILLPWAVLGVSGNETEALEELRASPVLEDLTFQEEAAEDDVEEELPTFDFPEPPTNDAEPEPEQDTAPPPPPDPEPEVTEEPDTGDDTEGEGDPDDGTDDDTEGEGDPDDNAGDGIGDEGDGDTGDDAEDEADPDGGEEEDEDENADGDAAGDEGPGADDGGDV